MVMIFPSNPALLQLNATSDIDISPVGNGGADEADAVLR